MEKEILLTINIFSKEYHSLMEKIQRKREKYKERKIKNLKRKLI
jgi:hypothetical protein